MHQVRARFAPDSQGAVRFVRGLYAALDPEVTLQFEAATCMTSAEAIDAFERKHGIVLPEDYRRFLLERNGGGVVRGGVFRAVDGGRKISRVRYMLGLSETGWHDAYEDIVFKLGLLGDSRSVAAIARAVTIPFPELVKWGNVPEFQRKCAYALARIGTAESREVLEILASSSDPQLREHGQEGLEKWPLNTNPHKRVPNRAFPRTLEDSRR